MADFWAEAVKVASVFHQERVSERVQQHAAEKGVPQFQEETVAVVELAPRERVQHRTAEQIEDSPQFREETVAVAGLAPRDREQQRSPQSPEETVEAATPVPHERMQQRTAKKIGEVPETASQGRRLQRTVEQAFVDRAEAEKLRSVASICGGIGVCCALRSVCSPRSTTLLAEGEGSE